MSRSRRSSASAGQRAQVIDGEEMLAESQPPRLRVGGPWRHQRPAARRPDSNQASACAPRTMHQLDRFGELGQRQSRGCLALNCREVFQPRIDTHEDHRDGGGPLVGELGPVLDGPRGERLGQRPCPPGRSARSAATAASRTGPPASTRAGSAAGCAPAGQGIRRRGPASPDTSRSAARASSRSGASASNDGVDHAQIQWRRQGRVVQEVGARPGPAAGPAPGRPAAPRGSGGPPAGCHRWTRTIRPPATAAPARAAPVPGPQLSMQHLVHQMVVAEARPLIIECHQEQAGRVDAAQQRRRVLPPGDRCARARGQLAQDGGVEHELRNLGLAAARGPQR